MLFSRYRSTYITPPSAFSVNPEARLPAIHFHVVWPADLDLAIYVLFRALRYGVWGALRGLVAPMAKVPAFAGMTGMGAPGLFGGFGAGAE